MAGGVGSPIRKELAAQLAARRKVAGKIQDRTNEDLLYQTSKTAWVKLSSGVNTITDEESEQLALQKGRGSINGSNTLAQSNILMGGLLNPSRGLREGIDTSGNFTTIAGVETHNSNTAYNNNPLSSGIRPMPGITSMNVKSKNTYGTLREAEVKFSVWSLEDFELVEKLYLRPGFTMLLEWGHSLYIDNNGVLIKDIETVSDEFFKTGASMTKTLDSIKEIRQKSDYNYEGLIGYVKNFSWSYTTEGGYECSVSLISTGEILESLSLRFDSRQRIPEKEFDTDKEKNKEQRKSLYHFFANKILNIEKEVFTQDDLKQYTETLATPLEPFTGYYYSTAIDNFLIDDPYPIHYIPIRTYFDIFNKHITLLDRSKDDTSPDSRYVEINTKFENEAGDYISSKYLTSPEHFTADPTVCVLPFETSIEQIQTNSKQSTGLNEAQIRERDRLRPELASAAPSPTKVTPIRVDAVHNNIDDKATPGPGGAEDVLNILIAVPYLRKLLNESLDQDGNLAKSMFDITRQLLSGMSTALGGINDFDLSLDEDEGKYYLIDRNNTNAQPMANYPELALAGVDSIYTDIGISSKISNEMGSQISVAAQGSTMNYSENVGNILKWNPNVIDRLRVTKDTSKPPVATEDEKKEKEEAAQRLAEWIEKLIDFYDDFNDGDEFKPTDMEELKTTHAEWTANNVVTKYKTAQGEPIPGIVPVELSFTTDGVGGFIIGQAFRISQGILPRLYQDKFGYIITGLEHSIDAKNRWETSVTTQFYNLEVPSAAEQQSAREATPVRGGSGGSGGSGGNGNVPANTYTSEACLTDSKIRISPSYNLAQLSCGAIVAKFSIPAEGQVKNHPTYGKLTRADIIDNLKALATNVLEPIKRKYPSMFVTNAYRNKGGKSQHEVGMAADMQFGDIGGSLSQQNAAMKVRAEEIKTLLNGKYDQFLLEYKQDRGGRPWIHISYRKDGKNRKEASTFLNDGYAAGGIGKLLNPLA